MDRKLLSECLSLHQRRLGTSPIVRALVDFDGGMDMVRDLDDITFSEWFLRFGGSRGSIDRMWDPIAVSSGSLGKFR